MDQSNICIESNHIFSYKKDLLALSDSYENNQSEGFL